MNSKLFFQFLIILTILIIPRSLDASPIGKKKTVILKVHSFVSDNFFSEKQYMVYLLQRYILEILFVQKKIYILSDNKFINLDIIKEKNEDSQAYQKFTNKLKTSFKMQNNNEFHLSLFFYRYKRRSRIKIEFFGRKKLIFKQKYWLNPRNLKTIKQSFKKQLKQTLCKSHCHKFQITTKPIGASVYIDEIYIGSSPIQLNNLPPGDYKLQIFKDSYVKYEEIINTFKRIDNKKILLKKIHIVNSLVIKTEPPDAKVYIDAIYKGQSPIDLKNIVEGRHSLKIVKKGFYPQKKIFFIDAHKNTTQNIILTSIQESIVPENHFWGDLTYQHLYNASFFSSFLFFSVGLYFSIETSNTQSKLLTILNGKNSVNYTQEDLRIIERSKAQSDQQYILSISFYTLSGVFLAIGAYFLINNFYIDEVLTHQYIPFKLAGNLDGKRWDARYIYWF